MKKYFLQGLLVATLAVLLTGFFYLFYHKSGHFSAKSDQLKPIFINNHPILAEIADTPSERELGLGNRKGLEENHGMLFVFDRLGSYGFWMKDTNFPLDLIWIDENKKIIDITGNVQPASYPKVFYPANPVLYVLEMAGGYAEKWPIKIGDPLSF